MTGDAKEAWGNSKPEEIVKMLAPEIYIIYGGRRFCLRKKWRHYISTWHRDLLNLAVEHQIISTEVRDNIAEYMGFRHFFIHAYGFQLDYELVKSLAENVADVYFDFKSEIGQFLSKVSE